MNRLSTPVLFISVLFFLTHCSSFKFYDSPRPGANSMKVDGRSTSTIEENGSPQFKKKKEAEKSMGNWFFIREGNEPENN